MILKTFRAMGCRIQILLDRAEDALESRLEPVPQWFEEWESVLSRFRTESELSRLNGSEKRIRRVGPILGAVLGDSLRAAKLTGGLVTPLVHDALLAAGYDRPFDEMADGIRNSGTPNFPVPDWHAIRWNRKDSRIRFPDGARLDFGGIAKGWAADRTSAALRRYGPALVDAGGDISASGPRADGSPWPVGVANPFFAEAPLLTLALAKGGVATSGRDIRKWNSGGGLRHHIIDPRTGEPAQTDVITATVIAPDARRAEAGAKSALILGSEGGVDWLNRHPDLAGMLVLADRRIVYSGRFADFIWN
jgi:thiamine biosynthesis lipoprotein